MNADIPPRLPTGFTQARAEFSTRMTAYRCHFCEGITRVEDPIHPKPPRNWMDLRIDSQRKVYVCPGCIPNLLQTREP